MAVLFCFDNTSKRAKNIQQFKIIFVDTHAFNFVALDDIPSMKAWIPIFFKGGGGHDGLRKDILEEKTYTCSHVDICTQ